MNNIDVEKRKSSGSGSGRERGIEIALHAWIDGNLAGFDVVEKMIRGYLMITITQEFRDIGEINGRDLFKCKLVIGGCVNTKQ